MCRSQADGGRRCTDPSHRKRTPEQEARRREMARLRYAQKGRQGRRTVTSKAPAYTVSGTPTTSRELAIAIALMERDIAKSAAAGHAPTDQEKRALRGLHRRAFDAAVEELRETAQKDAAGALERLEGLISSRFRTGERSSEAADALLDELYAKVDS